MRGADSLMGPSPRCTVTRTLCPSVTAPTARAKGARCPDRGKTGDAPGTLDSPRAKAPCRSGVMATGKTSVTTVGGRPARTIVNGLDHLGSTVNGPSAMTSVPPPGSVGAAAMATSASTRSTRKASTIGERSRAPRRPSRSERGRR